MRTFDQGRSELDGFEQAQPTDLFADDAAFQALVRHHGLDEFTERFHDIGRQVAGPLDTAVREDSLPTNAPVLDDWNAAGQYTGRIRHHEAWHQAGRVIYGTGMLSLYGRTPIPHRAIQSTFYLTAQAGESGHNCPAVCTMGAIRAVLALGTRLQKDRYLPKLLDPDFDTNYTASQFLTEVQGGSDVGANSTVAEPLGDPSEPGAPWRLRGEKWFCSNADADLFVVTARPTAAPQGTGGLGLFLVPRLVDGKPNGFRIRRLKEKLGTRTMCTAEIDFDGALGEALGPPTRGFNNVMELVINTSRIANAIGTAAHARRAWVIASTYAQHRRVFGRLIADFAAVKETLALIRADSEASLAATLWIIQVQERIEQGLANDAEVAFFRVAINLNKTWTALICHDACNRGVEILAGNGTIETLSPMPRLLRDNVVYENWEGAHNVLRAQVLKDCARKRFHHGFFQLLESRLGPLPEERAAMEHVLGLPEDLMALEFRRLGYRLATYIMLAAMKPLPELADTARLTERHLGPLPVDADYLALLDRLMR